eukprot:1881562-Amphidinium_carterae.1
MECNMQTRWKRTRSASCYPSHAAHNVSDTLVSMVLIQPIQYDLRNWPPWVVRSSCALKMVVSPSYHVCTTA